VTVVLTVTVILTVTTTEVERSDHELKADYHIVKDEEHTCPLTAKFTALSLYFQSLQSYLLVLRTLVVMVYDPDA